MAEWDPIRRTGKPVPTEVYEQGGRIELHFPLSARPPAEWTFYFEGLHNLQGDYPPLKVNGDVIVVFALQSQEAFASWTQNVDRDIAQANSAYQEILARREREREAAREADERRLRKLEEARSWTEGLDPPESS
jgi:hypothetical protein